jgi:hypothetical protein
MGRSFSRLGGAGGVTSALLVGVGVSAVCATVACNFPEINYNTYDLGADGGGVDGASSSDGDGTVGPAPDGSVPGEGSDSGGGESEETGTDPVDGQALDPVDGALLGDDGPPIVEPDAAPLDAGPDSSACACSQDHMYPTNVSCNGLLGLLCGKTSGFTGSPACGEPGQYVQCSLDGLACAATYTTRLQTCH